MVMHRIGRVFAVMSVINLYPRIKGYNCPVISS